MKRRGKTRKQLKKNLKKQKRDDSSIRILGNVDDESGYYWWITNKLGRKEYSTYKEETREEELKWRKWKNGRKNENELRNLE